jgi:hypothetical protein
MSDHDMSDHERREVLTLIIASAVKHLYYNGDDVGFGDLANRVDDDLILFGIPGLDSATDTAGDN